MKPWISRIACSLALVPLIPGAAAAQPTGASHSSETIEIGLNGHQFTLPAGFTIQLAASAELAPRPVSASFDDKGRLYVTDSAGLNLPPSEQLKDPRNRILRLEDTNGDGVFDRSTVYADRVMFPQGCLWHNGSVYVAGPPSIWKFTDTDNDGVADLREEWYQGEVLTGCANDVHGPYLGPEGMLYWTKGAFARLDLVDHRDQPIRDRTAHIFRAWPDKSGFEVVMSGGMDNPVEIAFTPEGEPILISTFLDLSQPGRRDGLAHAVYGGVFGKQNEVVDEAMVRRTGGLLPAMTHHGPAASCALLRYQSGNFGPDYRDNLFATLFNLRKVTRHVLVPDGATFKTQDSDFLVSDHFDFRPTDVVEDVDGTLLVVDTGGWYKLCCPSSQLAKADVLGGIYRVRRAGGPARASAGATSYAQLAAPPSLNDSREARLKKLATRADPANARELRVALRENTPVSASAASARVARVAAEGLGRMRDAESIPLLMAAIEADNGADRFLEHSLLYALIEIGDATAPREYLASPKPALRRAALLALEQIPNAQLGTEATFAALVAENPRLRETARWVVRRHPDWAEPLARHIAGRLATTPPGKQDALISALPLVLNHPAGQQLIADLASVAAGPVRIAALEAMANSRQKNAPESWPRAVARALASGAKASDNDLIAAAIRAARALPVSEESRNVLRSELASIASSSSLPDRLRLDALSALPSGSNIEPAAWRLLHASLAPDRPGEDRVRALAALERVTLTEAQAGDLAETLPTLGPLELPRALAVLSALPSDAARETLINALGKAPALRAIRKEDLAPRLKDYPARLRERAESMLAAAGSNAAESGADLEKVLAEISGLQGEIRRGQALFNSARAACSTCHRMGYLGGDFGPDLTSIGTIRSERDLLEALLFPSLSFVRSYEPWIALTRDGEEHSGILRADAPDAVVLATGPGVEVRLPREEIVELRPSTTSIMPAGLETQFTRQELADLLAFLKNTRWGAQ